MQLSKNLPILLIFLVFIGVLGFLFYKTRTMITVVAVADEDTKAGKKISESYYEYSKENLKIASQKGKTVLFFATSWCSTCTELDIELMDESERLDPGITVLKLDFDKDKEMVSKYKVLAQHTLVQVDGEGNEITKWVGGDLEDINKNVK